MSHSSLDAVIAAYLLAVEAGDVPNRQELLDRHPEQADALRAFFADLDRMDRVASPLLLAGGLDATGAVEAEAVGLLDEGDALRLSGSAQLRLTGVRPAEVLVWTMMNP